MFSSKYYLHVLQIEISHFDPLKYYGPRNAHNGKAKVYRPAPGTGSTRCGYGLPPGWCASLVCLLVTFFSWLSLPNFLLTFFLIWDHHPEIISDRLRIFFGFFFWLIYTVRPTKVSSIHWAKCFDVFLIDRLISHGWHQYRPSIPTVKYGWCQRSIRSILEKKLVDIDSWYGLTPKTNWLTVDTDRRSGQRLKKIVTVDSLPLCTSTTLASSDSVSQYDFSSRTEHASAGEPTVLAE